MNVKISKKVRILSYFDAVKRKKFSLKKKSWIKPALACGDLQIKVQKIFAIQIEAPGLERKTGFKRDELAFRVYYQK